MDPKYDHTKVESKIYEMWESGGYFRPEVNSKGKPFTIVLPPPNANANLHLGNALYVIEDILVRFKRMQGFAALWVPGVDHAGIQTQAVFEKKLLKEQEKNRYDLGREEFTKQIFEFCLICKSTIENQLRAMGFSLDWSREKFTIDPALSKIIYETFVKLNQENLVYRGNRIVNWCTKDHTTLSDQETEEKEQEDKLYYLDYGPVTIATTRPETIFADTAVAVNPKDKKYRELIGKSAVIPLINKDIPIISDAAVETDFGTGALKVTPGHDMTDFEIGMRHNLPQISVIDFNGKMTVDFADLKGMRIGEAREKTVIMLAKQAKLVKTESLKHSVKTCERCHTIIEPLISRQWFIKMAPLVDQGVKAVKEGKIKFIPKRWYRQYYHWMENLHDWPVSRQIWWGHQLPIYYCVDCQNEKGKEAAKLIKVNSPYADPTPLENPIIAVEKPTICPNCEGSDIIRDPDTFDTWFSSGQWPYTTLMTGNPGDFEKFYPTAVLDTGWEIFWLWVTRMIMFGLYTTKNVPFKTVIAHGMLRDEKGQKMSKSKGNGVDPIEMIEKYGADATRLGLVGSREITTDWMIGKNQLEERIRGYRNFGNKLWNIGRFIMLNLENKNVPVYEKGMTGLTKDDKVILKKLDTLIKSTTKNLETFKLGKAAEDLYQFIWHEFADKYIEYSKTRIAEGDTIILSVLLSIYLSNLKLLHPFMPFITEEIWSLLPKTENTPLIVSAWPTTSS